MKTNHFILRCVAAVMLLSGLSALAAESPGRFARIKSVHIEKTNIVVEVEASAGFTKVTVESSTRLGRKAWEPRGVQLLDATAAAASVTFTLPISPSIEILRVRGDLAEESLPASFFTGTNEFVAATANDAAIPPGGPVLYGPERDSSGAVNDAAPARSVVESDIWKLQGDTLYFFNQYRGLQVINVADPDAPAVTGVYDLPGAGEQMYVLDQTNIVLLARDNCSWYGTDSQSRVVLLQLQDGQPRLIKELPVPGSIAESRLVGSALYVVSSSYQKRVIPATAGERENEQWEWGSEVVSFDLSIFAEAQQKSRDWVTGYGNVIMATDQYLFVAQVNYDYNNPPPSSTIHAFDIRSPNGSFTKLAAFSAGGMVKDKFKMHVDRGFFHVVVQVENWQVNQRATYLHSFSLAEPSRPELAGRLKIIDNEQLFATRFHGDLLYAVTFFVIDPLWVIDLSDPTAPRKVGELEIPGWSTYLQPIGDKLLAIGRDQGNGFSRTAVQLFDVANPANPTLLSKVLIGDQWSSSEANWDEKAFGVLPEESLVLVPFYSSGTNGTTQGVQVIDLFSNQLVKRGVVAHNMGARRATLHRERLLSLSSRELLTVDLADRDQPKVVQSTQLSWAADRVHLAGAHVIEVDAYGSPGPALRVVNADNPSDLQNVIALDPLPYMGSTALAGKLYVLQGRPAEYIYPQVYNPTNYHPIATNPAVFLLSVFDLGQLPELPRLSQASREAGQAYSYGQYEALLVRPDLLVWSGQSSGYPWWGWVDGPVAIRSPASGIAVEDSIFAPRFPYWGGGAGHFIAVELDGDKPEFGAEVTLSGTTNGWWNFGNSFTTGGLVFTSHQASEFDPDFDPPPQVYSCWDAESGKYLTCTNDPPPGTWVQRYYLDVIDFSDTQEPLVRKPVNIPGQLIGLDRGGQVLFTQGYQWQPWIYTGEETIAASSFDGVNSHLLDQFNLPNVWPRPILAASGFLYVGVTATTNNANPTLQVWSLSDQGKFELRHTETLRSAAQHLELVQDMLVLQGARIELFDLANPADPVLIGDGEANSCYGVLLNGADGDKDRGLWVPAGWYGVIKIPVTKTE